MNLLDRIIDGSAIEVENHKHTVLGKGYYVTQSDFKTVYAKVLLDNHYVLVVSPSDSIAYYGKNYGKLAEFDSLNNIVTFNGKNFKKVNSDYQIMTRLAFGSPLEVEGEVMYWDYEADEDIISIAVVSRTQERADVIAKYVDLENIKIIAK